jgi:hypothetical protein
VTVFTVCQAIILSLKPFVRRHSLVPQSFRILVSTSSGRVSQTNRAVFARNPFLTLMTVAMLAHEPASAAEELSDASPVKELSANDARRLFVKPFRFNKSVVNAAPGLVHRLNPFFGRDSLWLLARWQRALEESLSIAHDECGKHPVHVSTSPRVPPEWSKRIQNF